MSNGGMMINEEKSSIEMKGPPPPVAPKPSWARQSTATNLPTVGYIPSHTTTTTTTSAMDSSKSMTRSNVAPVVERHSSEKFLRSSSLNQTPVANSSFAQNNESLSTRNQLEHRFLFGIFH